MIKKENGQIVADELLPMSQAPKSDRVYIIVFIKNIEVSNFASHNELKTFIVRRKWGGNELFTTDMMDMTSGDEIAFYSEDLLGWLHLPKCILNDATEVMSK